MIVGLTVLAIALSLLLVYDPSTLWRMFSFLLRRSEATSRPQEHDEAQDRETPTLDNTNTAQGSSPRLISNNLGPGDPSPDTTPKATAQTNASSVPSFSLFGALESDDEDAEDAEENLPPPQFPAMNSSQRVSGPKNNLSVASAPQSSKSTAPTVLMPPPPLPLTFRTTLAVPSSTTSLRIPSSGPLPNRGLAPLPSSSSLSVQLTSAVKTPNPRKKVLLAPGHSPLDWAHLIKSNKNLSGVDRLIRVTPSMLKHYNGRRGKPAWASYQGKVYNISPYLPYHPGGEGELRRAAGKDGEKLFMEVHPWVNWDNMLGECLVGIMVSESDGVRDGKEKNMDDMD